MAGGSTARWLRLLYRSAADRHSPPFRGRLERDRASAPVGVGGLAGQVVRHEAQALEHPVDGLL